MRILFVEDNLNTGLAMKVLLELRQHQVDHAANVAQAMDLLRSKEFDLLISDLSLPDGTGYDILSHSPKRVPAIALSGYASEHDRAEAISKGFREFLTKPFKTENLLAAIERVAT
ncbi:MAG: response regulator [Bacteroidota bacterium]|nr:response regulator [Bacteroidota bacterium]MDP4234259.1 response regulator [Bacteroidota bacterium]MDP4243449.1 response regulator [Bacteroidota bacterium]MDP4289151.1 response regulator [Bacteroidota bacterium]